MYNKEMLMLWILDKCDKLETGLSRSETFEDALVWKGKLEILQELFSDFNLEDAKSTKITYHSEI